VVLIVLFGSKKLPDAARSLGKSMRILKTEVTDLHGHEHEETPEKDKPAPAITSQPTQVQVDELQQQVRDLQAKTAAAEAAKVSGAPAAGTQHTPAS
jgi:sec-independent protein translocase protein TatA